MAEKEEVAPLQGSGDLRGMERMARVAEFFNLKLSELVDDAAPLLEKVKHAEQVALTLDKFDQRENKRQWDDETEKTQLAMARVERAALEVRAAACAALQKRYKRAEKVAELATQRDERLAKYGGDVSVAGAVADPR